MTNILQKKIKSLWHYLSRIKFQESKISLWLTYFTLFEFRFKEDKEKTFTLFDIRLVPAACFTITLLGVEFSLTWHPITEDDDFIEFDIWWLGLPVWSTNLKMMQEIEERKLMEQKCKK